MSASNLTLFFDGNCLFCVAEMARLRGWDGAGHLVFVDIAESDFDAAQLGVNMAVLNRELHSRTADRTILVGIDSMLAAYTIVGKGWLVFPLRMKPLRPLLAFLYRKFARNRYHLSKPIGYKPVPCCNGGVCHTR